MKRELHTFLSFMLAAAIAFSVLCTGETASAAASIYVNDSQNVLSGDLSSAYAVGGTGTVSVTGGTYAITGNGTVEQIGQTTSPSEPTSAPDGPNVTVKYSTVRIGLYYYYNVYRDTALATASLENKVGSGYKFGYYDKSRNFIELGSTSATQLTMVPDVNSAVSAGMVGCYHIKLPGTYSDFASAQSAASMYSGGFPAWYNGTYYAMVGSYQSSAEASSALASLGISGEVYTGSSRCVAVTKTGTASILFEFDYGTTANLAVRPVSSSGKAITWFKGYAYYGDFEYYRYISGKLTVINVLPLEDYVKGVVPYEMSPSWPLEALKAQALCARTYYAVTAGRYSSFGFDVTADTYCQAYRGTTGANSTTDSACDVTAGRYITYNGALCSVAYFSSDGGGTEDSENIFTYALPYCRGVIDPYEELVPASMNAYKTWTRQLTSSQLSAKLQAGGYSAGNIVSISPEYSDTNNVIKLTLTDDAGTAVILTRSNIYSVLGLPSVHFTVTQSAADSAVFDFCGSGWGHNVGMSQFGAYSMAKNYNYGCRQILGFYFTGVNISMGVMA